MKKLLLGILMMASLSLGAQNKEFLKSVKNVTFFGVDYSKVNLYMCPEPPAEIVEALLKIDRLLITEPKKYITTIEKKLGIEFSSIDIENVMANLKDVEDPSELASNESILEISNNAMWDQVALADLDLQSKKGVGLIILAVELDKVDKLGYYKMVFFDMETKVIHDSFYISGRAAGFGLRNYWAGSLYDAISKIKIK